MPFPAPPLVFRLPTGLTSYLPASNPRPDTPKCSAFDAKSSHSSSHSEEKAWVLLLYSSLEYGALTQTPKYKPSAPWLWHTRKWNTDDCRLWGYARNTAPDSLIPRTLSHTVHPDARRLSNPPVETCLMSRSFEDREPLSWLWALC